MSKRLAACMAASGLLLAGCTTSEPPSTSETTAPETTAMPSTGAAGTGATGTGATEVNAPPSSRSFVNFTSEVAGIEPAATTPDVIFAVLTNGSLVELDAADGSLLRVIDPVAFDDLATIDEGSIGEVNLAAGLDVHGELIFITTCCEPVPGLWWVSSRDGARSDPEIGTEVSVSADGSTLVAAAISALGIYDLADGDTEYLPWKLVDKDPFVNLIVGPSWLADGRVAMEVHGGEDCSTFCGDAIAVLDLDGATSMQDANFLRAPDGQVWLHPVGLPDGTILVVQQAGKWFEPTGTPQAVVIAPATGEVVRTFDYITEHGVVDQDVAPGGDAMIYMDLDFGLWRLDFGTAPVRLADNVTYAAW